MKKSENPIETRKKNQRAWYKKNQERIRAQRKAREATPEYRKMIRDAGLKRNYGLSPAAFSALLAGQGGACAVCRTTEWTGRGPQVDHDHKTKSVRGILCHGCNLALGFLKENPKIIRALAAYIEEK
jgi:hypothetical protein